MKKIRNIVLHMGADKTGSTAIQRALGNNAECFERLGVLCSLSPSESDLLLLTAFCDDERAKKKFHVNEKQLAESKKYLNNVRERVRGTTADTLIFSHEGLMHLNNSELTQLYAFVHSLADNIHVVLYVRAPESYAISGMSQRVKSGRHPFMKSLPLHLYENIIKRIISVFGRECLDVRLFDSKVFPSGDVVLDFLSIPVLKQLQNLDRATLVNTFKVNPSLSWVGFQVGVRILAILKGQVPRGKPFKDLFCEDLCLLQGQKKIALSPLQRLIIKMVSARHTNYLEREFSIAFSDYTPNPSNKLPNDQTSRQIELMARDLIAQRLPDYQISRIRLGWRWFLCGCVDLLSGSK